MGLKKISKIFFTGLLTVLPVFLTGYILYWIAKTTESLLGSMIRIVLPDRFYLPGIGLVIGVSIIFVIGMLMMNQVGQQLIQAGDTFLRKLPVVKNIYGGLRDISEFLKQAGSAEDSVENVVAVQIGEDGTEVIGFLMNGNQNALPEPLKNGDLKAVYLPMSYQVGGYTLLVPPDRIRKVQMPAMEAVEFVLTAGMGKSASK